MIEIMLALASGIFDIVLLYIFYGAVLRERREKISFGVGIGVYIAAQVACMAMNYWKNEPNLNLIVSFVGLFLVAMIYASKWWHRVIAAVVYQVMAMLGELITLGLLVLCDVQFDESTNNMALIISKLTMFVFVMIAKGVTNCWGRRQSNK